MVLLYSTEQKFVVTLIVLERRVLRGYTVAMFKAISAVNMYTILRTLISCSRESHVAGSRKSTERSWNLCNSLEDVSLSYLDIIAFYVTMTAVELKIEAVGRGLENYVIGSNLPGFL